MKMLSKTSAKGKSPKTQWNQPDVRVHLSESDYCRLLNCMVDSLFWPGCLRIDSLANLSPFIDRYERLASWARSHSEVDLYFRARQVSALFKKLELPLFTEAAREKAFTKWQAVEAGCREMNKRCYEIIQHPLSHSQSELADVIEPVRKEILSLIGEVPPDWESIAPFMTYGPGASTTHRHKEGGLPFKLQHHSALKGMDLEVQWLVENTGLFAEVLLTRDNVNSPFEELALAEPAVDYVDHAKLDFVPKSISEMRTIEIGPSLATLFQSGYDGVIRRLLKRDWGLDLTKQEPNRKLAYDGSVMGEKENSPCTIDLSAASDRISFGIVALLLPRSWVRTLAVYRAKRVRYGDDFITLEKFSSMGNALTFSLQTLIFAAVVRSVLRDRGWEGSRWRVYGDDIIVPRRIYKDVVYRLETLGFRVNPDKSFSDGFFRESCGADYLHGTNVRPLFITNPLSSVDELFKVLNLIQFVSRRGPIPAYEYRHFYKLVLSYVPKKLRLYGDTRNALDSCIWSPSVDGNVVLRRRTISSKIPDKLEYLVRLFSGYQGGLVDWTRPIDPHVSPGYYAGESVVLRRSPQRGRVARPMAAEELPFDPLLLG